jgi:hypothetical protein
MIPISTPDCSDVMSREPFGILSFSLLFVVVMILTLACHHTRAASHLPCPKFSERSSPETPAALRSPTDQMILADNM